MAVKNFPQLFGHNSLTGIADVLAETGTGLTNSEIDHLAARAGLPKIEAVMGYTKRIRLADMFSQSQAKLRKNQAIVNFVLLSCDPSRFIEREKEFESMRTSLNKILSFSGVAIN